MWTPKVTICDDERIIREGLKQITPRGDYHFDTIYIAKDGAKALLLAQQHQSELVATDIRIPRKNSIGLLSGITHLDCNVTILLSCGDFEYMEADTRYHVLDYLPKPVDHAQLEVILGRLVRTLLGQ